MYYCIKCYGYGIMIRVSQPNMWQRHCPNCGNLAEHDIIVLVPSLIFTRGESTERLSVCHKVLPSHYLPKPSDDMYWPSWRPDELERSPETMEKPWKPDPTMDQTGAGFIAGMLNSSGGGNDEKLNNP